MRARTDEQLIDAAHKGDQSAFEQLMQTHINPVHFYILRQLGGARRAEVDDIVQETFLRVWQNAGRYRAKKSAVTTWIHQIAHNLCIDWWRRQKNQPVVADDETTNASEFQEHSREADLETEQKLAWLYAQLPKLAENQRSALLLFHFQGFSTEEVAQILDSSTQATESLLARARRRLKKLATEHKPGEH